MEPADAGRAPRLPFPVVGIGASAGGLEAFAEFLAAMPPDGGMAFVLIQHLPPDRESLLADILAGHTRMPVRLVEGGEAVEPDHVYVIRPGHTLTIGDGRLHLGKPLAARGHGRPVDDFFRSLAEEQQQRAVAVVFSGMGTNGTAGAEAVKTVGGVCVAQDPASAKFTSMPRSLIDSNLADYVLRPAELPAVLLRYARHPYARSDHPAEALAAREAQTLADILAVLRTRTKYDFSGYRKPTIVRRVQRRMGLTETEEMVDYARSLRLGTGEVQALADDLLIHVTGFFRDPEAWDALRTQVIDPLVADRPAGGPIRAWVTACATGEEAYTLAMLLVEAAEARGKSFDIKLFATDMADRALGHARAGLFPGGIESEISPERLDRFFDPDGEQYRVKKPLRELVVFAPQNVLHDPPFSRLDIVTCRNLLIYLEPATQKRVLQLLHFALREGGALMLGGSETAGAESDDFAPIDKKHRLFRRVGPTRHGTLDFPLPHALRAAPGAAGGPADPNPAALPTRASLAQAVTRALVDRHTPAAVAADAAGQISFYHGDTGRFLDQPRGEPTRDLLQLANEQVRGAVREAFGRAVGEHKPVQVWDGEVDTPAGRQRVRVGAAPLDLKAGPPHYLVTFHEHPVAPARPGPADDAAADRQSAEARRAREELQGTLEELQTANEEMRAANEEVVSINEELQSANEELETSKEEMQSLNEELTTVNAQLLAKMDELETTGNDLASLLASTDIAVLFLDPRFRIRRYTPAATDLFELIPADLGRPLHDLREKFADPDLLADCQRVLDRLVPVEREVGSDSGRWYVRRVLPYRTQDSRIDGVVVTFLDISRRRAAEAALRQSEERFRGLAETVPQIVWSSTDNLVDYFGPRWYEYTGQAPGGGLGAAWQAAVHPADLPEALRRSDESNRTGGVYEAEYRLRRADGEFRWHIARAVRVPALGKWFGTATDVHDLKAAEAALRASEARLRAVADHLPSAAVFLVGPDLRYQLAAGEGLAAAGFAPADFEGKTLAEALRPDLLAEHLARYEKALAGAADTWDHAAYGRHYLSRAVPLRDPAGAVAAVLAVSYDITDRVRAEQALREGEERFRLLVENARDHAIFGKTPDGRVASWNPGAERLFGYAAAEVVGESADRFFTPEGRAAGAPQQELATAAAAGRAEDENWLVRKDGGRFWASGTCNAVRDPAGRLTGFVKVVRDRTEARAAAEAVRQGEERLRLALTAACMGIWDWDVAGDLHTRDANLNRLLGLPAEATRRPLADFLARVHPDDRQAVADGFERSVRHGDPLSVEFRVVWPDGTVRWLRDQGDVFGRADGGTDGGGGRYLTGACVDVTALKEVEGELRAARDELEGRVAERTTELHAAVRDLQTEAAGRRTLQAGLVRAQEEERTRIARELHDSLGQYLTGMGLGLSAARAGGDRPELLAVLDRLTALTGDMGREAHRLALELRPTALDDVGLEAAVQTHVERWAADTGVKAEFGSRGLDGVRVPEPAATAIYRAVQEALTNVLKHAGAATVSVLLDLRPDGLEAIIEDDGRGFDPDAPPRPGAAGPGGLGLLGMRERIALAGGTLEVESAPGSGTTVFVRVPLAPGLPT